MRNVGKTNCEIILLFYKNFKGCYPCNSHQLLCDHIIFYFLNKILPLKLKKKKEFLDIKGLSSIPTQLRKTKNLTKAYPSEI